MGGIMHFDLIEFAGEPECGVDARDLHANLKVTKDYSTWIKRYTERAQLVEGEDFICSPNRGSKDGRGGHNRVDYILSLDAAKHIALMQCSVRGRKVRSYFIEVEKRARSMYRQAQAGHRPLLPMEEAAIVMRSSMDMARMFGLHEGQAAVAANKATLKTTGINPRRLLECDIPSDHQELYMTPTELGRRLKYSIGPIQVNELLHDMGFQESTYDAHNHKRWRLLPGGTQYGVYTLVEKADGRSSVQYIKWCESVIPKMEAHLEDNHPSLDL
jgi:phage anti-repressor protein